MSNENHKTVLQTTRVRPEWNERGGVDFIPDENGTWKIVSFDPKSGITNFTPAYQPGIDPYGQIKTDNNE